MSFVPVFSFDNYIDANLRMGQLQEEGINCWLKDEHTVVIDPILTNAIGGIKLMVHETQKERAMDLLRIMRNREKENHACPHCGSFNVEYIITNRKASNWLMAIVTFLLGSYAVATEKRYHCFDCGEEFEEKDRNADETDLTDERR